MLNIKKADCEDLNSLSRLFDCYRVFYNMPADLKAATNFMSARLSQQDSIIYLACQDQKSRGFLQIYPSFSSVAMQPTWIINDLYVDHGHRRRGIAVKLLAHVACQARNLKIFNLQLATAIDNEQAQAVYNRFGFKKNTAFYHYSLPLAYQKQ